MRRFSRVVSIPPGGVWPNSDQGVPLPWWRYILIENRGVHASGNDVWVSLDSPPLAGDSTTAWAIVPAGTYETRNVAGEIDEEGDSEAARDVFLRNIGGAAITVLLELDMDEIKVITGLNSP